MLTISLLNPSDVHTTLEWWGDSEAKPTAAMLPPTTYVVTEGGEPVASACLLLTNNSYAAMVEHLIANPQVDKSTRRIAVGALIKFLETEAKLRGYRYLTIFSYIDGLKHRYRDLGFQPTREGITTFAKVL